MIRTFILSAILALGSTVTAQAFCAGHDKQAMSCAEGAIWDSATQSCVPLASS